MHNIFTGTVLKRAQICRQEMNSVGPLSGEINIAGRGEAQRAEALSPKS